MKKYLKYIPAAVIMMLASCSAEEGTMPGTDNNPSVTVYIYPSDAEGADPDTDAKVRFANNQSTTSVYYLVESSEEYRKFFELGSFTGSAEDAYMERVIQSGTKIDVSGATATDVIIPNLTGDFNITAVAVGAGGRKMATNVYSGLIWTDVVDGTFYFGDNSWFGISTTETTLQVLATDKSLYRLKNVFGQGYSMRMQMLNAQGEDEDGVYTLFRIPPTTTPFSIGLSDGNDYPVMIEDVGYWQGNDAYVTSPTGYENGMYDDYTAFICPAWMAVGKGCFSYGQYMFFMPNQ